MNPVKSESTHQAVQEKIQREMDKILEEQWIKALKKNPETDPDAQDWLVAEVWGPR